jgi:hypothetical protein
MKRLINWMSSLDSRLDDQMSMKEMIILGIGFGVIFWGAIAFVLAAFGSL